jgi:hypothetical protein
MNLNKSGRKWPWTIFRYYPSILHEILNKTIKNFRTAGLGAQNQPQGCPKYEARAITT